MSSLKHIDGMTQPSSSLNSNPDNQLICPKASNVKTSSIIFASKLVMKEMPPNEAQTKCNTENEDAVEVLRPGSELQMDKTGHKAVTSNFFSNQDQVKSNSKELATPKVNVNENVQELCKKNSEEEDKCDENQLAVTIINKKVMLDKVKSEEMTTSVESDHDDNEKNELNNFEMVKKENFEVDQETVEEAETMVGYRENSKALPFIKKEEKKENSYAESKAQKKPSNHAIDAELEDGEVPEGEENGTPLPTSLDTQNICRFFLRKACTWGNKCRFGHPCSKDYGNYVMFEKKELPVPVTPIVSSEVWPVYSPNGMPNSEISFDRNLQYVKQMMQKAGYLPPPQNRKCQEPPSLLTFSFNNRAPHYPQYQPCSSEERLALLPTPKTVMLPEIQHSRTSNSYENRRSQKYSPSQERNVDDDGKPSKSRSFKQKSKRDISSSSSSSLSSSGSSKKLQASQRPERVGKERLLSPKISLSRCGRKRIRGPRTPSPGPPCRLKRSVGNASRKRRLLTSSSSSSKDSSSMSYDSSMNSSSSSDSEINRYQATKKKTSSRMSREFPASADKNKRSERFKRCSSKKSRQEYLLMKLLLAEDKIAKRKEK